MARFTYKKKRGKTDFDVTSSGANEGEKLICPLSSAPLRTPNHIRIDIFELCQPLSDSIANGLIMCFQMLPK
uniref:Uncharacterized protein n=1 Tax=Pristionchus pacificus TaxID=54126 RepID=A0A8R1UT41_PRIPA